MERRASTLRFPRSKGRGLIEAGDQVFVLGKLLACFRARKGAASLKPIHLNLGIRHEEAHAEMA